MFKGSTTIKKVLKRLLGTSLLILNHPDVAQEQYQSVADFVASRFHRDRDEDSHALRNAVRLAAGVGIGIGLGLLIRPSGQETRSSLSEKGELGVSPKGKGV